MDTGAGSPLFAIVAETGTAGKMPVRLARLGCPEIKNFTMSVPVADTVNRDLELGDLYNQEDAFNLSPFYLGAYRARLNANLADWDSCDGKTDWQLDDRGNHPLTDLLLADFLIVDVSKPFSEDSYFEIEQSMLKGFAHKTCGGRSLNDDIVDTMFTLYINAGNGSRIADGVDQASKLASRTFPYLQEPNPVPAALPDLSECQSRGSIFTKVTCGYTKATKERACELFEAAHSRFPAYAAAQGHLAEVYAALGDRELAIALLRPLAQSSDDPDYASQLSRILGEVNQTDEAYQWRNVAATRYGELVACYPEAFADHAAQFWLTSGANPQKALQLAQKNLEVRQTPRAYSLLRQATIAYTTVSPLRSRLPNLREGDSL